MPVRYYPDSKVVTDLVSNGLNMVNNDGTPYIGKYYSTYDGSFFSGPNPKVGPNERLFVRDTYLNSPALQSSKVSNFVANNIAKNTGEDAYRIPGKPNSYFPKPKESDYTKGYFVRYFTKRVNERGFVIEISKQEYQSIIDGTADYDISMYQVEKILWKLTGPLKSFRESQYNVIPGIVDTNERLTEAANKNMVGMKDFIGGEYAKFARPTA